MLASHDNRFSDESLRDFCVTIRKKTDWTRHILDTSRDLGKQWAMEAGFLHQDQRVDPVVDAVIDELKAEASRIQMLDHTVRVAPQPLFRDRIDSMYFDKDCENALLFAAWSTFGIRQADLKENVGVYVSDGLVPQCLHEELIRELDALASLQPKNFSPGTGGMIQNLIDPSLYPYIANTSPLKDGVKGHSLSKGLFETSMKTAYDEVKHSTKYSWIPSIFRMPYHEGYDSDDSESDNVGSDEPSYDVCIKSYINGLGPREQFPNLYRVIEKLFPFVALHFKQTLDTSHGFKPVKTSSVKRWESRILARSSKSTTQQKWNAILDDERRQTSAEIAEQEELREREREEMGDEWASKRFEMFEYGDPEGYMACFKRQDLKVIVKASNYILRPGQEYQSDWQLDGMPHDRIVASLVYFYDEETDVENGGGLSFRRFRDPKKDFPVAHERGRNDFRIANTKIKNSRSMGATLADDEADYDYPGDWEDGMVTDTIAVGTVPISSRADGVTDGNGTGRMISYPNWVQNKLTGMKYEDSWARNEGNAGATTKRTLCFFLVRDTNKDIPKYPGFSYVGAQGLSVLTTKDVLPQERPTNLVTLRVILHATCQRLTGRKLSEELVSRIIRLGEGSGMGLGLTREMAEQHRREFMNDQKRGNSAPNPAVTTGKTAKENDAFLERMGLDAPNAFTAKNTRRRRIMELQTTKNLTTEEREELREAMKTGW